MCLFFVSWKFWTLFTFVQLNCFVTRHSTQMNWQIVWILMKLGEDLFQRQVHILLKTSCLADKNVLKISGSGLKLSPWRSVKIIKCLIITSIVPLLIFEKKILSMTKFDHQKPKSRRIFFLTSYVIWCLF